MTDAARAKEVFLDALELTEPDRGAFLDDACSSDRELRAAVDGLLAAYETGADLLCDLASTPGSAGIENLAARALHELDVGPGEMVGDYRLEQELGEGGFGRVFRAEQLRPVRRHVALKLLKLGMDSRGVLARFEAERQVLARMDHPHIASVLDAGATPEGRPYLVMELVDGEPITSLCARRELGLEPRLELFRLACLAVQHAHAKGVLHRDVKPNNVLVTELDGELQPRVIDFGVAKAIEDEDQDRSNLTADGHLVGTPAYMSPEQLGAAGDVDTRSDVYALGVLLYELVAGAPPFAPEGTGVAAIVGLQRQVLELDPAPPSGVARSRGARGAVRGDVPPEVDWICLRALEKNRERRYATAFQLAADVGRLLSEEPVEAAPPSRTYRLRKLVARHRAASLFAGAALLALLLGAAGTSIGLVRAGGLNEQLGRAVTLARDEADEARAQFEIAEAVNAFLTEDLLRAAKPSTLAGRGRDVLMSEVLEAAAERIDAAASPGGPLEGKARVEGRVRHAIGQTFVALGRDGDAAPQLERALDLLRAELGEDHVEALRCALDLADADWGLARNEEAAARLEALLPALRDALGPADQQTLTAIKMRASVARALGDEDEAGVLLAQGLEAARAAGVEHSTAGLGLLHGLAIHHAQTRELAEAERLFREVVDVRTEQSGPDSPSTLNARTNLAVFYRRSGRNDEALRLLEELLPLQRDVLGDEHTDTLTAMQNLVGMRMDAGRGTEAAELAERVVEATLEQRGPDHPETLGALDVLALVREAQGDVEEAERIMRDCLERSEQLFEPGNPEMVSRVSNLGILLWIQERYAEAEPLLERALELNDGMFDRTHPYSISHLSRLAKIHRFRGDHDEAERALLEALDRAKDLPAAEPQLMALRWDLCEVYRDLERWDEAVELLTANLTELQGVYGEADHRGFAAASLIMDTYVRAGRLDEARAWEEQIRPYLDYIESRGGGDDVRRPPPEDGDH